MTYETDCLQRQIIEMSQQLEGFEQWRKTAGGLRVPATVDDWGRYAEVSKKLDELREQVDKLTGHVEALWDQIGENNDRAVVAGHDRPSGAVVLRLPASVGR